MSDLLCFLDCVTGLGSPKWATKSGAEIIERKLAEERRMWERSVSSSFFAGCQRPAARNDWFPG
jgi:hypothetical protein